MIYDYALVWLGWQIVLTTGELEKVKNRSHSWVVFAECHGLEWYHDTFQNFDEEGNSLATLLVGKKVETLGYKESNFELRLLREELLIVQNKLTELMDKYGSMPTPSLWILYHLEE